MRDNRCTCGDSLCHVCGTSEAGRLEREANGENWGEAGCCSGCGSEVKTQCRFNGQCHYLGQFRIVGDDGSEKFQCDPDENTLDCFREED